MTQDERLGFRPRDQRRRRARLDPHATHPGVDFDLDGEPGRRAAEAGARGVSEPREYSLWFRDYGPRQGRKYPWEGRLPETQGGVKQRFERAAYRLHWHERVRCELLLAGWRPASGA